MLLVMTVSIQKLQTNIATYVYPPVTQKSPAENGRHTVDGEGTHYAITAYHHLFPFCKSDIFRGKKLRLIVREIR